MGLVCLVLLCCLMRGSCCRHNDHTKVARHDDDEMEALTPPEEAEPSLAEVAGTLQPVEYAPNPRVSIRWNK